VSNPKTIYNFLVVNTPLPYCDDCIAQSTSISPRQQVNPISSAFGLTTDFDRQEAICHQCKSTKLVTRSLRHMTQTQINSQPAQ
jgi:hypothetical protein